jgi:hypothetical protein
MPRLVLRIACLVGVLARAGAWPAAALTPVPASGGVTVRFELNDAQVKDQVLPGVQVRVAAVAGGVEVAAGMTGADGRFSAVLPPGMYRISYSLPGYVPYASGATEIRDDGQLVTVSLSRLLEATGQAAQQVRIILNWGSRRDQVKDADSHLACVCQEADGHVYYRHKVHEGPGHRVELDVDDIDWGGPETVTLTVPPSGAYLYWVQDYSGPPAVLGASDVVVRVVVGDQEAGEFRVFKSVTQRAWRPFKAIEVAADGGATVARFTDDEIAEGADLVLPATLYTPEATETTSSGGGAGGSWSGLWAFAFPLGVLVLVWVLSKLYRHRR